MKLLNYFFVALLFLQSALAQQPTQLLKIKVKDEDNLNLPGATVLVSPGKFSASTDQLGEHIFVNIQPGK